MASKKKQPQPGTEPPEDLSVQRACVQIESTVQRTDEFGDEKVYRKFGTGFLIAPDLVATCAHVLFQELPTEPSTGIQLLFRHRPTQPYEVARIELLDRQADLAVLRLESALTAEQAVPLPLGRSELVAKGKGFGAHGFAEAMDSRGGHRGLTIDGKVQSVSLGVVGLSPVAHAAAQRKLFQLASDNVAAGKGAPMSGMSGGPVLIDGLVVGVLDLTFSAEGAERDGIHRAEYGVVFAVPIEPIVTCWHQLTAAAVSSSAATSRPEDDHYVHRVAEERQALDYLRRGKPAVLWGPGRVGKTMMLTALTKDLDLGAGVAAGRVRVLTVDFQEATQADSQSFDAFLAWFRQRLARAANPKLATSWDTLAGLQPGTAVDRLNWLIEKKLLHGARGPIVISVIHVDRAWVYGRQNNIPLQFLEVLKAWDLKVTLQLWRNLRVLLEVSSAPALFLQPGNHSPINGFRTISLKDFTLEQIRQVAESYQLSMTDAELSEVMALTGGHPHLVDRLMEEAHREQSSLSAQLAAYAAQRHNPKSTIFHQEYQLVLDAFPQTPAERAPLWAALHPVVTLGQATIADDQVFEKLYEAGLIVPTESGPSIIRNRVYQDFLRSILPRHRRTP